MPMLEETQKIGVDVKILDEHKNSHPNKNKDNTISNKGENNNHNSANDDYTCCEQCGLRLPHCHCTCPYCGERDSCECALFDAATGG